MTSLPDISPTFSPTRPLNTLYEGMSGRFVTDLRDAVYA
jgi:hypothetical protein